MNWYSSTTANATSWGSTFYFNFVQPPTPPPAANDPVLLAVQALGLTPTPDGHLSWKDITKAFRRLARENHPDVGGDPERMKEITAAYHLLKELPRT